MNTLQKQRFVYLSLLILGLALATGLLLYALKENINVFMTPSQLRTNPIASNYVMRLGGIVKQGSTQREKIGLGVTFIVTDLKDEVPVYYQGILPDLFREGTGVIAEGVFANGQFKATRVLAKHDEKYMPKKVYEQLRQRNS